jgi:hypothetical protein
MKPYGNPFLQISCGQTLRPLIHRGSGSHLGQYFSLVPWLASLTCGVPETNVPLLSQFAFRTFIRRSSAWLMLLRYSLERAIIISQRRRIFKPRIWANPSGKTLSFGEYGEKLVHSSAEKFFYKI